jgi:hypothetical protein
MTNGIPADAGADVERSTAESIMVISRLIGGVEPHLEEVNRFVHPLRRIGDRARGRGRQPRD